MILLNKEMLPKITRKSLLYKSNVEYADFCLNHVEGCSNGCIYPCYAMMMKKRCGIIKNYSEWLKPKIVANALELLDKEIPKYKNKIKFVHLCFSTDPFMYKQPEVINLTLKIIEKLNLNSIRCTVLTKGILSPKLIDTKKYSDQNEYGITIVSLDEIFRKKYEPFTPTFKNRIKALKKLHDVGLKTWVSMEPYPTPNIVEQDLSKVLKKISFVDKIVFGRLNYNPLVSDYKDCKNFYNTSSEQVMAFCKSNNIRFHIKKGTYTQQINKNKKGIFENKPNRYKDLVLKPNVFSSNVNIAY